MSIKKRGLGRGLDAFLPEAEQFTANPSEPPQVVALSNIDPNPNQPRKNFDEARLAELAASIKEHGILQPLLVCPAQRGRYLLVAGERRWRASRMAGLKEVPVVVRELTPDQVLAISLVENLQRDDLGPIEEAEGISSLMQTFSLTQDEAAQRLGKSRPAIANSLRLLSLCAAVRAMLEDGRLSAGHGRALAGIKDEARQTELANYVLVHELSVRQLEQLCREENDLKQKQQEQQEKVKDEGLHQMEEALMRYFGTKVAINGSTNRGSISISYYSRADLERLYEWAMALK